MDPAPSAFLICLEEGQVLNQLLWLERFTETKETRTTTKPPNQEKTKSHNCTFGDRNLGHHYRSQLGDSVPRRRAAAPPWVASQSEPTTRQRRPFLDLIPGSLDPPSAERNGCAVCHIFPQHDSSGCLTFLSHLGTAVGTTGEGGEPGLPPVW